MFQIKIVLLLVFAYAQELWAGDQNITKVYKRGSDTLPWIEIASYNVNTPEWTLDTLYVADSSDQLEIAFEGIKQLGSRKCRGCCGSSSLFFGARY